MDKILHQETEMRDRPEVFRMPLVWMPFLDEWLNQICLEYHAEVSHVVFVSSKICILQIYY